ncbi:MAG TPA: rod shape-determining protein MreD [Alphaproteobacteria bacterium]|nr:rod shape-determining protein MreD [Alphaproteobacteria bacterium]
MFELFWQRLDSGARQSLPFITTLVCTLFSVVAWPLPHIGSIAPPLGLIVLYYWSIHRPDLLRPGMVFAIGLLNDALNSLPIGLSALLFVAVHQILFRQRRFFAGHSFFMMWFGFILMITGAMVTEWLALDLWNWHMMPFFPVLMQCILSIVIFPIPCWLLIRLQRATLTLN